MLKVHPETGLPCFEQGGHTRILAALEPRPVCGVRAYAEVFETMPESEWAEFDNPLPVRILDQDGQPSCCGHGSCSTVENARTDAGMSPLKLSPTYVYCKANGGRNQGAVVEDCMNVLLQSGICTEDLCPELTVYERNMKPGADAQAKENVAIEALKIATFEELMTATMLRQRVCIGILVGSNFGNLDTDGFAPMPGGGGGGHCLASGGGAKKSSRWGWATKTQNSWGTSFGRQGLCYVHRGLVEQNRMPFDAFVLRVMGSNPKDPTKPPKVA